MALRGLEPHFSEEEKEKVMDGKRPLTSCATQLRLVMAILINCLTRQHQNSTIDPSAPLGIGDYIIMFRQINEFNLEAMNFGERNNRVLVFRLVGVGGAGSWEKIKGTRTLLIGGKPARREMKRMLNSLGRAALKEAIPGGINSRTHTSMRKYFDL